MRIVKSPLTLLVLAFLAGQLLGVIHGVQHPAADTASHICQICAHGQPNSFGALPSMLSVLDTPLAAPPPKPMPTGQVRVASQYQYPIRGPPQISV